VNVGLVFRIDAWILVTGLALAMGVALAAGVALARRSQRLAHEVDSTLEAAVFALLGLLLAFSFSMAGARYERQRQLIAEEANAIGTAALRADLYPEGDREAFRREFHEYLESRIADQDAGADVSRILAARERTAAAQRLLWARASRISQDPKFFVASYQMTSALNEMFDAAGRRFAAERTRVPDVIVVLLFVLCVAASFLYAYVGQRSDKFESATAVCFVLVTVAVVFVTIELDRPRRGLINVRASEESLVELRALF
jgi:hypothetical protein